LTTQYISDAETDPRGKMNISGRLRQKSSEWWVFENICCEFP